MALLQKALGATLVLACGGWAAEAPMGPVASAKLPDITKQPTLHVIGYSHLDTQWCWLYPQTINEFIRNTLDENFTRLEKYPSFVINFSGANRYRMMKEYYPEKYERVKQYAAQGRWFPAGGSMEENDVNSPSAEAILRQLLYGSHWFRRELGTSSQEFMLPDCFGFPASLPTLLHHGGMKGFSTQKLTWGSAMGIPFNLGVWTGPDGNGVVAALNAGDYTATCPKGIARNQGWLKRIQANGEKSGVFADYLYHGVGDRGGAPRDESCRHLEEAVNDQDAPIKVVAAKSDELFKQITPEMAAKLPHYQGDLLLTEHSAGSISSQAYMKHWHHQAELGAEAAEKASALAEWLGALPYDRAHLNEAWYLMSMAEFHDILPGTSLPKAYEYSQNDLALANNLFSGVQADAVAGIARALDLSGPGVPLVVYNPLPCARAEVAEAMVKVAGPVPAAVQVLGPDGQELPSQVNARGDGWLKIAFLARADAAGLAVYHVVPVAAAAKNGELKATANSLENARYKVTLNNDGDIASVFDKAANRELLAAPMRLAFQHENPSQYPAWNMDWNDQQKPPRGFVSGPARISISENGAARIALTVERASEGSVFRQTVRLAAGGERVEFLDVIDWRSKECALKATFPLAVANPEATYNWEVGTVRRGNNNPKKYEVPTHQWLDLSAPDGQYGVTLLTGSKYGSDKPDDRTIRLTLVYTPGVRGGFNHEQWQDWGRHEILYGLAGHAGTKPADWEGYRLDQPFRVFQAPSVPAAVPGAGTSLPICKLSSDRVRLLAMKKAEESDEIIVRLVNLDPTPVQGVKLSLFAPVAAAREVNAIEDPVGPAVFAEDALVTDLGGFGIRSFALKLRPRGAAMVATVQEPLALAGAEKFVSKDGEKLAAGQGARVWPAEQLPTQVSVAGIGFRTDGSALVCRGQALPLPAREWTRLGLLVAADQDGIATFSVAGQPVALPVQCWQGYVGQWDHRLWNGQQPDLTYGWPLQLAGLEPAYLKPGRIAAFTQHLHDAQGKNLAYDYGYLQYLEIPLPAGCREVTLPNVPGLRIVAATVDTTAKAGFACTPASARQGISERRQDDLPTVTVAGPENDVRKVSFSMPLYWTPKTELRYTLDGSAPAATSPQFSAPVLLWSTTTVKAQAFEDGQPQGGLLEEKVVVDDRTAPAVAFSRRLSDRQLEIGFSEPVVLKEKPVVAGAEVVKSELSPDGASLALELKAALPWQEPVAVTLPGVADRSPQANLAANLVVAVPPAGFQMKPALVEAKGQPVVFDNLPGLPVQANEAWTMNLFVCPAAALEDYTVIAGFGDGQDHSGTQRYLTKFPDQLHFWGSNIDIGTNEPLVVGQWQMLTVTYSGKEIRLYKNGKLLKKERADLAPAAPVVKIAPPSPWGHHRDSRFAGKVANFTIRPGALSDADVAALMQEMPKE